MSFKSLFEHLDFEKLKDIRDTIDSLMLNSKETSPEFLRQTSCADLKKLLEKVIKSPEMTQKVLDEIMYRQNNKLTMTKTIHTDGRSVEEWKTDDQPYRKDGPYYISRYPDGSLKSESYKIENICYCNRPENDGPAYITFWPNGKKKTEQYYNLSGRFSRKNGPASTVFDEQERPTEESYCNKTIKTVTTKYA